MNVADLEGPKLDYWVAKADDWFATQCLQLDEMCPAFWVETECSSMYSPSTDWAQGGPIIERERISVTDESSWAEERWAAFQRGEKGLSKNTAYGPKPLVAAMRAFVCKTFGEEVPDE